MAKTWDNFECEFFTGNTENTMGNSKYLVLKDQMTRTALINFKRLLRVRRVEKLRANAATMRAELLGAGIPVGDGRTQILPLIVGAADTAVALSGAALERGAFVQAIRPPSVAEDGSRLRLTVMASHNASDLRRGADAIAAAAHQIGVSFREERPSAPTTAMIGHAA